MSIVEEKEKLIKVQRLKIESELRSKFYKKGSFWASFVSALIALSSAIYVGHDYFKGNEKVKRENERILLETKAENLKIDTKNLKSDKQQLQREKEQLITDKKNLETSKLVLIKGQKKLKDKEDEMERTSAELDDKLKKTLTEIRTISDIKHELDRKNRELDNLTKGKDIASLEALDKARNKIANLERERQKLRKLLQEKASVTDYLEKDKIKAVKHKPKSVFDEFELTLLNVSEYKKNSSFTYRMLSTGDAFSVYNLAVGDAIARQFGVELLVIKVLDADPSTPENVTFELLKIRID